MKKCHKIFGIELKKHKISRKKQTLLGREGFTSFIDKKTSLFIFLIKITQSGVLLLAKRENKFQPTVIKDLKKIFPGCMVLKNDAGYIQGIPDLTVVYKDHWAMLETKRADGASKRPNQDYYVDKLNSMSYSAFINPENKEDIYNELKTKFQV